jgi:predicted nucleotidyltransferase
MNGVASHPFGLDARARALLDGVLERYPSIREARVFGSRALDTHRPESDIDLALYGDVDDALAARVAGELDELPLPYQFDVRAYPVRHAGLREHIDRVGRTIFTRRVAPSGAT